MDVRLFFWKSLAKTISFDFVAKRGLVCLNKSYKDNFSFFKINLYLLSMPSLYCCRSIIVFRFFRVNMDIRRVLSQNPRVSILRLQKRDRKVALVLAINCTVDFLVQLALMDQSISDEM